MRIIFGAVLGLSVVVSSASATESSWNGAWRLDAARSTAGASEFAAAGYVLTIEGDGHITWQIPELGEVVKGKTDGQAMAVHRTKPTPGLTLSVQAEGPWLLHYAVARNGKPEGAGIMRLIEGGKAWVDISWQADKPEFAGELVYVRQ